MTVAEFIEWLKTQDQSAIVEVLDRNIISPKPFVAFRPSLARADFYWPSRLPFLELGR